MIYFPTSSSALRKVGLDCIEQRSEKLKKPVKIDRLSTRIREKPFHKTTLLEKMKQTQAANNAPFDMLLPGEASVSAADTVDKTVRWYSRRVILLILFFLFVQCAIFKG